MNTVDALKSRRSCRKFTEQMPPEELISRVLEAGTYAPSGRGKQSPIIVAVTNKEVRDRISRMNAEIMGVETDPFYHAPVIVIVLADASVPTYLYDGSLVLGNIMNAAEDAGLGSIWIHRAKEEFESEEGKALLREWGIEGDYEGIGHCALGFKDEGACRPAAERKGNYIHWVR